ncbi:NADH-quinone oxidoreductase subunit NuoE [Amorphus sp. 3PC139-8]|uniref:NADH-quinone oxidoreductase subunit NuoE n=1 Tax=Amorphus sp. 3PC139-8 TaxID=2735676 RepID=UPI00345CF044
MAVRRLAEEQPESFEFTSENLEWAKKTIAKYPDGRQASAVIPLLWRAQEQYGWLPEPAIRLVAEMLDMPYIRVFEVATFYTMFLLKPVGTKAHIQVCGTTPCQLRGAEDLVKICKRRIAQHAFDVSEDGAFSWEEVECLGACVNAPMVQIGPDTYEDLTPESFEALIDGFAAGKPPEPGPLSVRKSSEPTTGATTLTDPSLYDGSRNRGTTTGAAGDPAADASVDPATPAAARQTNGKPQTSDRPESEAARGSGTTSGKDKGAPSSSTEHAANTGSADPGTPPKVEAGADDDRAAADAAGVRPATHAPGEGKKDDLQRVSGIGPKIEQTLNELGVSEFAQIAAWTPENVAWVDTYLKFRGRIERENWIAQAKELASQGEPAGDTSKES